LSPPGIRAQQEAQHRKRVQHRHRHAWHGESASGSEVSNVRR
jgi:hypothetical protein